MQGTCQNCLAFPAHSQPFRLQSYLGFPGQVKLNYVPNLIVVTRSLPFTLRRLRVNARGSLARSRRLFSSPRGVQRPCGLNLLKYLHLVASLQYCRVRPNLGEKQWVTEGPPCPAQKRRRLPIVYGVKSTGQAWNSSARSTRPRPASRILSSASTSSPAGPAPPGPAPPAPGPQSPPLPGTWTRRVPQTPPALRLFTLPRLTRLPGSTQRHLFRAASWVLQPIPVFPDLPPTLTSFLYFHI